MALSLAIPVVNQPVVNGATSKSFFIYMSGPTGVPVTGKVFNSTGLVASYAGTKLARVAITLADLAAITTAWASGGFKEVDSTNMPGWYRIDVPNAALALAADEVVIEIIDQDGTGDAAGTIIIPIPTATVGTITTTLTAADLGNPLTGTLAQNVEAIGTALPGFDVTNPNTTRTDN
jgi:hypothetical protein